MNAADAAREGARQADGKFGTYALPKASTDLSAAGPVPSAYEILERDADDAYDREDQVWFDSQSTEDLKSLWEQACDINRGASWDDEVYEALAKRGHPAGREYDFSVSGSWPTRIIVPRKASRL